MPVINRILVADLPQGDQIAFVSDSQDVEPIKRTLGEDAQEFDSFFVETRDGEYKAVWGIYGIVPNMDKQAYRLL
jgi:hypothetical protein